MATASSSLLIAEPPLQVLPGLAVALGLNDAIILQQLHYWLGRSKHLHDGQHWVFNSLAEWHEQFPWWSEDTIGRALARLTKRGIVLRGNHAVNKWDRTLWYGIDYRALSKSIPAASEYPLPQIADIDSRSEQECYMEQETTTETSGQETTTESARARKHEPVDESFVTAMVAKYGDRLRGADHVRETIAAALNHTASRKWIDKRKGVDDWLRRDAERYEQNGRQNGATVRHAERNPEERPHNRFVEFDNV